MMNKRTLILSMTAASAGAAGLRNEGFEAVGELIEHFPAEVVHVDRRLIEDGDETIIATQVMEEYFDEFPDLDIMGNIVEDPEDIIDEDYEGPDIPLEGPLKEYAPDPEFTVLVDSDLMGEATTDQRDRREAACSDGQSEYKILCKTDNYGYEFSWKLMKSNGGSVAFGPPSGTNYADNSVYSGRWCLSPGSYKFQLRDKGSDGLCSNKAYGCGYCKTYIDGNLKEQVNDQSRWSVKNLDFQVTAFSARIDGTSTSNSNLGTWCKKVRSVTRSSQGTCTLSNGQRGHRVRVNVKTDKYGMETSFQVLRSGSVKMKMGPIVPANSQKTVEDCLPAGKYTFQINDLDGVCCRHGEGGYTVSIDGQKLFDGGSFVKTESREFTLGHDWVAGMSERDCEWWWAHDYRRRDWHTRCYPGYYCNKEYVPLKWSKGLASDAQTYANKLLSSCLDSTIHHDATDQGENLAKNVGQGNWGRLYDAELVTRRFVDNEEFWGWNKNAHLTQAMWRASKYFGCGESVKNLGNNKLCRMQVCRFAKAGNCMMGSYNADKGNNWMIPVFADDSPCGPVCPPDTGCFP